MMQRTKVSGCISLGFSIVSRKGNYSGMLIGRMIAILYFLARKIRVFGISRCSDQNPGDF